MRVLLIEPETLSAQLYTEALEARGCGVTSVQTAQHALDALDNELPDCIVLELDMREHNGFEFLYEFSSHEDWNTIPIIVHSSVIPDRLHRMSIRWDELNVKEYLYKASSTLQDLQVAVSDVIKMRA